MVLRYQDHIKTLSGAEANTSANRMHLLAAINGLQALKRPLPVHFYTGSDYVRDGITKWVKAWQRRKWQTKAGKPVSHRDLWETLLASLPSISNSVASGHQATSARVADRGQESGRCRGPALVFNEEIVMTTQRIHGVCPHDCPDTCGLITEVEAGRAVKLYGDPDHPVTQGWLCAKVRPYLDHVYHPDRLKYPLRRVGPKGSGQWVRITWPEAIAEIAERWQAIIAQYGAEAILPYSYSGTLGLVQMEVASSRFWNRLGASQLARTICCAAAHYAVGVTLGGAPQPALCRGQPQ